MKKQAEIFHIRWLLVLYDLIVWIAVSGLFFILHPSRENDFDVYISLIWIAIGGACILVPRFLCHIYTIVWRYGGLGAYSRLIFAEAIGGFVYVVLVKSLPIESMRVIYALSIVCMDLLACMTMRITYYYVYRFASRRNKIAHLCNGLLRFFGGVAVAKDSIEQEHQESQKTSVAIVGAGRIGATLAEDLLNNPSSGYNPICFIEKDPKKAGRNLLNRPILYENSTDGELLEGYGIKDVIIAIPNASTEDKKRLFDKYKDYGINIRIYDYPLARGKADKKEIRSFTIEELLQRDPIKLDDEKLNTYYRDKVVMVTGGGGSIGSELCRQIAAMKPEKLIILDIAENTSYELQQELTMKYGKNINLVVEICNIVDRKALDKVFEKHKPNIVLHAAAHKHVPLMERNSVECIKNNVQGTLNTAELAQVHGVQHFIMVSTDKAVNPTNIMGASKRCCEMIVMTLARRPGNKTIYSATRFGNVLGSAGSVVPLFKKQIAKGGPVTITHKDIIRYFMTIPEAVQLVLTSGAIAENGELFVLDMGKPVRIYDLAINMIRLSGYTPYEDIDIIETGLRPGEKLFEELLIDGENQTRTENELIFIEKDEPISEEELRFRLSLFDKPLEDEDDEAIKEIMKEVVPTYIPKEL